MNFNFTELSCNAVQSSRTYINIRASERLESISFYFTQYQNVPFSNIPYDLK